MTLHDHNGVLVEPFYMTFMFALTYKDIIVTEKQAEIKWESTS